MSYNNIFFALFECFFICFHICYLNFSNLKRFWSLIMKYP
nr:MAG TPA: hypothetical protein [Caudoviricetes sp.]